MVVSSQHRSPRWIFGLAAFTLAGTGSAMAQGDELRVDFGKEVGVVRPLHGVNGGPLNYGETVDLTSYWREIAVPLTRLHDCEWPRPDVVDMSAIFPDPNADPSSPASYRFAKTDGSIPRPSSSGSSRTAGVRRRPWTSSPGTPTPTIPTSTRSRLARSVAGSTRRASAAAINARACSGESQRTFSRPALAGRGVRRRPAPAPRQRPGLSCRLE